MRTAQITFNLFAWLLFSSFTGVLSASTEIVMAVSDADTAEQPRQIAISIQGTDLRVDGGADATHTNVTQLIYKGAAETLLMIDHDKHTYSVMDKKTITDVKAKMDSAMKEMEAQLAQMPPEQRQMMEKMMKGRMPMMAQQAEQGVEEFRKTDRKSSAGGYECAITEVYSTGKKVTEICVTPWSEIKSAVEINATFNGMIALFTQMFTSLSQSLPMKIKMPFTNMQQADGFPVMVTNFKGDRVDRITKLVSIDEKAFPSGFFEAPASYTKREIMGT
jgi:hypothetical protein